MITIKLIKKTISLIITPVGNIDFEDNEIVNNILLDELELNTDDEVIGYNMNTNSKTIIKVSELTENSVILINGILHKIIHLVDNYR